MLDTYIVSKAGYSLYEVRRYKASSLMETHTLDFTKNPRSDFETKRMSIAKRYASEGCPKGSAYWFGPDGSISCTKLAETGIDMHGVITEEWPVEARKVTQLARLHKSAADRHNMYANQFSKSVDDSAAHREAASAHKQAGEHYERASGAYRRGASAEAESHMEKGKLHGSYAKVASMNAGASHFFRSPTLPESNEHYGKGT